MTEPLYDIEWRFYEFCYEVSYLFFHQCIFFYSNHTFSYEKSFWKSSFYLSDELNCSKKMERNLSKMSTVYWWLAKSDMHGLSFDMCPMRDGPSKIPTRWEWVKSPAEENDNWFILWCDKQSTIIFGNLLTFCALSRFKAERFKIEKKCQNRSWPKPQLAEKMVVNAEHDLEKVKRLNWILICFI